MNDKDTAQSEADVIENLVQVCRDIDGLCEEVLTHEMDDKASRAVATIQRSWRDVSDALLLEAAHHEQAIANPGFSLSGEFQIIFTKLRALVANDEQSAMLARLEQANVSALSEFDQQLHEPLMNHTRAVLQLHRENLKHVARELEVVAR